MLLLRSDREDQIVDDVVCVIWVEVGAKSCHIPDTIDLILGLERIAECSLPSPSVTVLRAPRRAYRNSLEGVLKLLSFRLVFQHYGD